MRIRRHVTLEKWSPLLLGLSLVSTGCGGPKSAEEEASRVALVAALDAWKGGESSDALLQRSPPINVADYRWKEGFRLTKYQVTEGPRGRAGLDARYPVDLWLTTPRGKSTRERAVYNVSTRAALTVVRDPES